MSKPRTLSKGFKNTLWNALDAAIYPVIYVVCMPSLMESLGLAAFGFWIVLNTMIVTLQLFNLNIGLTTIKHVSFAAARGDKKEMNALISALFQITFALAFFVACCGLATAYVAPKHNLFGLSDAPVANVFICLALTTAIAALKFFDLFFNSLLKAVEEFKRSSLLNSVNRTGLLLLNVILAFNGFSVVHLLWSNVAFILVYLIVQLVYVYRTFPFLRLSFRPAKQRNKALLQFSIYPWMQFLIVVIAFQTDRFWVSAFAGLKEVSAYGLVATIFNHVHMIFVAMASWMLPRISSLIAQGADPASVYFKIRGWLLMFTTISLLGFYFIYPVVFSYWLGESMYRSIALYMPAFIAFELVFVHTIMPFFYLNAASKERSATMLVFMYAALSYLLMLGGLYIFKHPLYMVYGMTIAMCVTMPALNKFVEKQLGRSGRKFAALADMLPGYLAIIVVLRANYWLSIILLPVILFILCRLYMPALRTLKTWKQLVKL